jgi:hypothetical protein
MSKTTIPLTTGVTGTLPVANGGTGLTSGTTGQFLKFTGTTTVASSAVSAGITVADHYYLASSTTAGTNGIVADSSGAGGGAWTKHISQYSDTTSVTTGSGGGVFSFPTTGFYMILASLSFYSDTADNDWAWFIEFSDDNFSSHSDIGYSRVSVQSSNPNNYIQNANHFMIDVTNTTNDKFRVTLTSVASGNYVYGANEKLASTLQIYRLGET